MRLNLYICTLAVIMMFGCVSSSNIGNGNVATVGVDTFSEEKGLLAIDSMLAEVDTLTLPVPSSVISYNVEDACIVDGNIYLLDQANNIMAYSLETGKLICSINAQGKGHGEYVKPAAIASDNDNVYVLDMAGLAVNSYDRNLKFKERINIGFPCLDLEKTETGFLLYNLNANDDVGRIVVTDNGGVMVNDFLKTDIDTRNSLPTKHIFQKNGKAVCIIDPWSFAVYKYEDEALEHIASLEYNDAASQPVRPVSAFIVNNKVISQYWSKFVMTSIHDTVSGKSQSGIAGTGKSDYGFMPIVQHANSLYGIYPDTNEGSCYHLVRYRFR